MLRVITLDFSPLRQGGAGTVCGRHSDVGEGMALAKGLVLLGVEGLSFQVDLTDLGTMKVQSHEAGGSGRGPFIPQAGRTWVWGSEAHTYIHTHVGGEGCAYCTNKACVMPAEAQRFQEAVSSINLEVTASTFRAKHLLIVW